MKLNKFLTFAMVSGVLFTSCSQEDEFNAGVPTPGTGETGSVSIYLEDLPKSYAATSNPNGNPDAGIPAERTVNTLEFYVFNEDETRDQVATTGKPEENNPKGYVKFDGPETVYQFGVEEGKKTILVAVNMNLGALEGQNLETVRKKMTNVTIDPLKILDAGIPMAGETTATVDAEDVEKVTIAVSRLYAKLNAPTAEAPNVDFDVKELAKADSIFLEELGVALTGKVGFRLFPDAHYYAVNGLKPSYAFVNYGALESQQWDHDVWQIGNDVANYTKSVYGLDDQMVSAYSGSNYLAAGTSVYFYENSPKRIDYNSLTAFEPTTVYAFIVKGELFDTGKPDNKLTRYWRINVHKTTEKPSIYNIWRNAAYNVDIKNVKTIGHGTPKEAEIVPPIPDVDEAGVEVTISLAPWRIFNENTDI